MLAFEITGAHDFTKQTVLPEVPGRVGFDGLDGLPVSKSMLTGSFAEFDELQPVIKNADKHPTARSNVFIFFIVYMLRHIKNF